MEMWVVVLLVVAVLVAIALAAWFYVSKRRTDRLAERYGPEYRQAVETAGDRSAAEKDLEAREERVRDLDIRPLSGDERRVFVRRWEEIQTQFVDDPHASIGRADTIVTEVMEARGYPMADFEQRAADISVDHPRIVQHYRAAHAVAERHDRNGVDTEELRRALVDYRALFDELVTSSETQEGGERERPR